jgi:hypothetical protein
MTEILTESFCERCGTRYTFESARPRARMKGVKVLSRGLKNFVLSDDTSMDEAMAAARSETDREATAHQLDAFHQTFNFCMSCRQYTCPNCWNEVEARCLSCAPHLGHEIMPAPFPDMPIGLVAADPLTNGSLDAYGSNGSNGANGAVHEVELIGVAETEALRRDEEVDATARLEALTATTVAGAEAPAEPEVVASEPANAAATEPEAVAEVVAPAEPEVIAEITAVAEPEPEPVAEVMAEPEADDPAVAARSAALGAAAIVAEDEAPEAPPASQTFEEKLASQTSGMLQRFRPGQSLDAELEAYEREQAAATGEGADIAEPAAIAEPVAVAEVVAVAEIVAEPEPEVVAEAEVVAEPEPEVVAAQVVAEPEPGPEPVATVVDDVVPQPMWHMVAPDAAADLSPTQPTAPPTTNIPAAANGANQAEPQWPDRPVGGATARGLPFLGRPAAPQGGLEALWAESTREVVATPAAPGKTVASAVQPCVSCGLSLSATARFCRRCGTAQGG